jgi:hypothetical protein
MLLHAGRALGEHGCIVRLRSERHIAAVTQLMWSACYSRGGTAAAQRCGDHVQSASDHRWC